MTDINELIKKKNQAPEGSTEKENAKQITAGVFGLGLIGGSFAKAYHAAGHKVLAYDTDSSMLSFAMLSGAVDQELTRENYGECDLILLCTPPAAATAFLEEEGPYIGNGPLVIDCCGTKRVTVNAGMAAAERFGFTFIGGHPMAGTQFAGFKHAQEDMFVGAPMVIVPPTFNDIELLTRIKELLSPVGFQHISVTTADNHDETIAFTSQLAHVVSCAYIKSPTAQTHKGFSAGSYKDMTRVALLNPYMWSELLLDNRDNILNEIDYLVKNLSDLRTALADQDKEQLTRLLADGRRLKEVIDG